MSPLNAWCRASPTLFQPISHLNVFAACPDLDTYPGGSVPPRFAPERHRLPEKNLPNAIPMAERKAFLPRFSSSVSSRLARALETARAFRAL